jgi:glycosyltransferase involved in cell wall biosynthesis
MQIAVDTRMLRSAKLDGIGRFAHEILSRVVQMHPEHHFHFFFDRPYDKRYIYAPNVKARTLFPRAMHPLLFRMWYDLSFPKAAARAGCEVMICPGPLASTQPGMPQLTVLHDLNFVHHPGDMPKVIGNYYRKYTPRFVKASSLLATVSEFSKADIAQSYSYDPARIAVIPNAASKSYRQHDSAEIQNIRNEVSQGAPYFLFVSSICPRKNLNRLLQAYDRYRLSDMPMIKMLVVGDAFWRDAEIEKTLKSMQFRKDVIFLGHQSASQIAKITAAAWALTYVSYFEGFGIPILEAFQSGVPVIAGDATALPEVAGGAAILANPFNVDDICGAMQRITTDLTLRDELIELGLRRAQEFSWDSSAQKFFQAILHTLHA